MKFTCLLLCSAAFVGGLMGQTPGKTHLKVGDQAPGFTLPSTTGKPISLADLRGKTVVVGFFPAAFTGG